MKLRHQFLILLVIPIIFHIVSVWVLNVSLARVDEAVTRESRAKRAIQLAQDISSLLARCLIETTGHQTFGQEVYDSEDVVTELNNRLNELKDVTSDNPAGAQIAAKLDTDCRRLAEQWTDVSRRLSFKTGTLISARFLRSDDYLESTKVLFDDLQADNNELRNVYGPLAKEFEPSNLNRRGTLRLINAGIVVFDVLLVCCLAITINRVTLARLAVLMKHIHSFASSQRQETHIEPLQGKDELAELDQAFSKMAQERKALEETRNALVSMVTHDIRSPLTSMLISLESLQSQVPAGADRMARKLQRLVLEAERLQRLSKSFLDIDRLYCGKIDLTTVCVRPADIVETTATALEALLGAKSLTVKTITHTNNQLLCDRVRTVQVMINLMSNAVRFAPPSSELEITIAEGNPRFIRISISDRGPGVPEDQRNDLFKKFSQLAQTKQSKAQGSGMGLYLAKMLVEAQNGLIGYEPNVDAPGSCFWFELPTGSLTAPDASLELHKSPQ